MGAEEIAEEQGKTEEEEEDVEEMKIEPNEMLEQEMPREQFEEEDMMEALGEKNLISNDSMMRAVTPTLVSRKRHPTLQHSKTNSWLNETISVVEAEADDVSSAWRLKNKQLDQRAWV